MRCLPACISTSKHVINQLGGHAAFLSYCSINSTGVGFCRHTGLQGVTQPVWDNHWHWHWHWPRIWKHRLWLWIWHWYRHRLRLWNWHRHRRRWFWHRRHGLWKHWLRHRHRFRNHRHRPVWWRCLFLHPWYVSASQWSLLMREVLQAFQSCSVAISRIFVQLSF